MVVLFFFLPGEGGGPIFFYFLYFYCMNFISFILSCRSAPGPPLDPHGHACTI